MTYPAWICAPCGDKYGNGYPEGHVSTWHLGTCHLCGNETSVTEPRDFRHLKQEPWLFRCALANGQEVTVHLQRPARNTLRTLDLLDRDLTKRGHGPMLSITVRGLTFHRTPGGAYQRTYD